MEWESKLAELVDEYRAVRARVRAKRSSLWARATSLYTRVADTPRLRPFLSAEGQQYCFTFTLGLCFATAYTLWVHPHLFRWLHLFIFSVLYAVRFRMYSKLHWWAFCFDFCYIANVLTLLSSFVPDAACGHLATAAFVAANGPVLWAVVMWRNSTVFHSVDKMISVAVHVMPPLATYASAWTPAAAASTTTSASALSSSLSLIAYSPWSLSSALLAPLAYYLLWQAVYSLYWDHYRRELFAADPEAESSLRWFTDTDRTSPLTVGALKISRRLGLFGPDEEFNFLSWRTKLVFYTFQLAYTVATFPAAWFAYADPLAHGLCIGINVAVACNNAAGYYLSNSYVKQRLAKMAERQEKQQQLQQQHQQASTSASPAAAAAVDSTGAAVEVNACADAPTLSAKAAGDCALAAAVAAAAAGATPESAAAAASAAARAVATDVVPASAGSVATATRGLVADADADATAAAAAAADADAAAAGLGSCGVSSESDTCAAGSRRRGAAAGAGAADGDDDNDDDEMSCVDSEPEMGLVSEPESETDGEGDDAGTKAGAAPAEGSSVRERT